MGRGPGWLERAILDLLGINEYLSAPLLAAKAYTADAPDAPDPPPDEAIDPTPAQRAAVRRALSKLQKRGLVVKLGSRYPGERCSYADREHALTIVRKEVQHLGLIPAALSTASSRTVCRRDCAQDMNHKKYRPRLPANALPVRLPKRMRRAGCARHRPDWSQLTPKQRR